MESDSDPIDGVASEAAANGALADEGNNTRTRAKILVVDDERFFRERIRDVLREAGLPHTMAETGEGALEAGVDPEVGAVILDIELPDISGLEVFRQLREKRPDLRVIVLSAHTHQEYVLEALRLGACDYLAKPIHDEELTLAARRALESFELAQDRRLLERRLDGLADASMALAAIGSEDDRQARELEIAAAAVRCAADLLDATKTSLMRLEDEGEMLRVVAVHGRKRDPDRMDGVRLGEDVAGRVAATGEALLVADTDRDARFSGRGKNQRYSSRSFLVVPLPGLRGRPGVLCATDRRGDLAFGNEELATLTVLAAQVGELLGREPSPAAPTVEMAEAVAEAEDDQRFDAPMSDEAELARAICDVVTADVDPGRFLPAALARVAEALDAEPVSIYVLNPESRDPELVLEAQCAVGARADRPRIAGTRGLTGTVLSTGNLVASAAPTEDPRFDGGVDAPADGEPGPFLCGPLRFRDKTLGVFRVFLRDSEACRPRMGELLAAVLGAALRNALLYRSLVETIEESAQSAPAGRPSGTSA
ncbi:MAG: response regulator [Myxococcales bacterium]|nr:response regulator [Myxococcales bacterium]